MPNEYFSFSELQGAFMPQHINAPSGHIGHLNIPTAGHIGIGLVNKQHINTPSGSLPQTAGHISWNHNSYGNTDPNNSIQASQFIKHHLRRNNKAHIIAGFIGADSAGRPY